MSKRPTVIELFAGAGGAASGLSRAGYKHLASVEMWPTAVATLRAAGFPGIEGRVEEVDLSRFKGHVDLLWASPPCQPYSSAGKRLGALDPRDGWDATLLRVIELKPRALIIENVTDAPVDTWARHVSERSLFKYVEVFTLCSDEFGVPQRRCRDFVYAGHAPFPHAALERQRRRAPRISEVLPELAGKFVRAEQTTAKGRPTTELCPTVSTRGNLYVWDYDPGVRRAGHRIDPNASRPLSPREIAALTGFPKNYPFQGTKRDGYKMVGNAVAPPIAEAIGRALLPML